jgi:hypothetical protein
VLNEAPQAGKGPGLGGYQKRFFVDEVDPDGGIRLHPLDPVGPKEIGRRSDLVGQPAQEIGYL